MKNILKQIVINLLELEAKAVLKKYKPKIVAITGTVGKTSTKDAIYTALSNFYFCRKSQKSNNSELGIPLSVLGLKTADDSSVSIKSLIGWGKNILDGLDILILPHHYPEWLILEIGTDRPGDIEAVTKWIKPDITVVTKLSKIPVHVEFFPSPQDVFVEKGKLVEATKPGGTIILNADDEDVLAYKNLSDEKIILFGNEFEADIQGVNYEVLYDSDKLPSGISFEARAENESHRIELLETLGAHHSYHILAALAVVLALNEDIGMAARSFRKHEPTPGRMRLIPGIKGSVIIDDSYNSSPIALEEALKTLKSLKAKRKIAVLGDMLELGKYSLDAHKKAGEMAKDSTDILITVGLRSRATAESALDFGMAEEVVFQFDDSKEAGGFIQNILKKGDVVLVKGSQGIRVEKTIEEIMAEPEKKEKLLVRQYGFWKYR
jgi:UDP-N-acetylmuramoyl-tripeptide--D-alanyl-D-alanine ligase